MTKEYINFKVDNQLKKDFETCFKSKYDKLDDIYEFEILKLLKFILALNGYDSYQHDPDVLDIMDMVDDNFTRSHIHQVSKNELKEIMEEKIRKLEEKIEKLKPSQKRLSMEMYIEGFLYAFKDNLKITKKDIEKYTMLKEEIIDRRSIKQRIRYLEALDIIKESDEPGVYINKNLSS